MSPSPAAITPMWAAVGNTGWAASVCVALRHSFSSQLTMWQAVPWLWVSMGEGPQGRAYSTVWHGTTIMPSSLVGL